MQTGNHNSRHHNSRHHNSRRGAAVVEMALSGTLLMLLAFGAADFAAIFFDGLAVANAAGTGAFYGGHDNIAAGDFNTIEQRVRDDAEDDVGTVNPTVTQICRCPGAAPFACVDYGTVTCAGYGAPRAYVRVQVEDPFDSSSGIGLFPNVTVRREAWMRVR